MSVILNSSSEENRINATSKTEKFLPDITSFDDFEENSSFTIENEKIELYPMPEKDITNINSKFFDNLQISNEKENYNIHVDNVSISSNKGKFIQIGSMSLSSIKNYITNNSINIYSETTQNNNSLKKLNSMIVLEKVKLKMQRGDINLAQEQNIIEEEEEKIKQLSFKKITYKRKKPIYYFLSKYRSYCIIKCELITTFFLDNYVWSIFTNPKLKEKDGKICCKYVVLNKKKLEFEIDEYTIDNLDLDDNLVQKKIDRFKFKEFIIGVNQIFRKQEFLNILKKFKKKKILGLSKCCVCFVIMKCIIFFSIINHFFKSSEGEDNNIFWFKILGFILFIAVIILLFIKNLYSALVETSQMKKFEVLEFHVKNFNNIEEYFEKWNIEFWIPSGICISCPVSLDYIQFSLDPFIDIELQHHEIGK
jgi:hypothetical protein